jgi:hypothetical protein
VKARQPGIGACLNQPGLRGYLRQGLFATLIRSVKESRMFGLSFWHIGILLLLAFLLFGGRLSDLMGAAGKAVRQHGDEIAPALGNRLMPPFLQKILRVLFNR